MAFGRVVKVPEAEAFGGSGRPQAEDPRQGCAVAEARSEGNQNKVSRQTLLVAGFLRHGRPLSRSMKPFCSC